MATKTRTSILEELTNLDPAGVPTCGEPTDAASWAPLPGLPARTRIATVLRIEPARRIEPLVWAVSGGQTILFRADDATLRELQDALAAGEEPTAIVEPCQIVAFDV